MKVKNKKTKAIGHSNEFNTSGVGEMIVRWEDDLSSEFISDFDVWIVAFQAWEDMAAAFKRNDLITDNFNTMFFEPKNPEERERGYRS